MLNMSLEKIATTLNISTTSITRKVLTTPIQYDILKYSIKDSDMAVKMYDNMKDEIKIGILKNPALTSYEIVLDGMHDGIEVLNQQFHFYVQHNIMAPETIMIQLTDKHDNTYIAAVIYCNKNSDNLLTTDIICIDDEYTDQQHNILINFISSLINFIFTINYLMINKPEILSSYTKRSTPNINKNLPPSKKPKSKKKRKTLVQKVININTDSLNDFYGHGHHNITCPCWGVVGHWRTYKSGKRVWIKPHKRGRDKDKYSDNYVSKEYVTVGGIVGG